MTSAKSLMHKPIAITQDSTVSDALRKLLDFDISRLVVKGNGNPAGIITEKDLGYFLFKDEGKHSLHNIHLTELAKNLVYVNDSASPKRCAEIMFDKEISSLAVGTKEHLQGILTKTDIVKYYSENYAGKNKVADLKNPGYISVQTEASLSEVIKKMLDHGIRRIIVINQKKEPIGIISFRDFFRISLQLGSEEDVTEAAALSGHMRTGFLAEKGFGGISLARDIMTPKIISVTPDDDLAHAAKVMVENKVSGLFVKDKEGRTGLVSKTDIVRFLTLVK